MAPTQSLAPAILPAALVDLRQELASAIADEKYYNAPAHCIRLGLPPEELAGTLHAVPHPPNRMRRPTGG